MADLGPNTLAAAEAADVTAIAKALVAERAIRFASIVKNDPSQSVFIEGWIRRCMHFL
jgi:hypothetical protein